MTKSTELCIYGDIGEAYWFEGVTADDVREGLRELDENAAVQTVRLNSPGGAVDEGLTIMNLLRSHKAGMRILNPEYELHVVVDGYAMSAASCILMAGDQRILNLGAIVMIHDAWSYVGGNAVELRKVADNLDKLSDNAADIYARLCVPAEEKAPARDVAYFRQLMRDETYLVGDEAINCGLCTSVDKAKDAVLISNFSPENLKGKYVQTMLARKERQTFSRPKNKSTKQGPHEAVRELSLLAMELGLPPISSKI